MIAKEIVIGFLITIAANMAGMFFYITIFSEYSVEATLSAAIEQGFIGSLIALGAILNFLPFFVFLKKNQLLRVRGAVLATLLAAIVILITKF
ncbi:MAG TPA: hypothetical protein VFM82_09920 [Flavobacteriaceae bacterium]|nr:hypothetical protein [Flavobacteriaceae bacterium]